VSELTLSPEFVVPSTSGCPGWTMPWVRWGQRQRRDRPRIRASSSICQVSEELRPQICGRRSPGDRRNGLVLCFCELVSRRGGHPRNQAYPCAVMDSLGARIPDKRASVWCDHRSHPDKRQEPGSQRKRTRSVLLVHLRGQALSSGGQSRAKGQYQAVPERKSPLLSLAQSALPFVEVGGRLSHAALQAISVEPAVFGPGTAANRPSFAR
jgi:hypothetical protein